MNIIPFPIQPRAVNYEAMATEQAYGRDGLPARVGDRVTFITGPMTGMSGTIYALGATLRCKTYDILCSDGVRRLAYADGIEVMS